MIKKDHLQLQKKENEMQSLVTQEELQNIERFYLETLLMTSAAEIPKVEPTTIRELPGSIVYIREIDRFRFVDILFSVINGHISNTTQIFIEEGLVWQIVYTGYCLDPSAIPFFRGCLRNRCENGQLIPPRGTEELMSKLYKYKNTTRGAFEDFSGYRSVSLNKPGHPVVLRHKYSGGLP